MLMMGPGKSKKIATLIIGSMGSDSKEEKPMDYCSDEKEESDSVDHDSALEAAAKGMISCLKKEDPKGLADAMKTFVHCCMNEMSDTEESKKAYYHEENNEVG